MTALSRMAGLLGRTGQVALALVVLALLVVVLEAVPVVRVLAIGALDPSGDTGDDAQRRARFVQALDEQVAQVNGRSMFFVPPRPPAPARVAEAPRTRPVEARPATPQTYAGPKIIAMVNGSVWFDDGTRADVGGDEANGLKVLSSQSPWSARVLWKGAEFDVPLFERTTERFLAEPEEGTGS